jgi:four helix bundle protein
MSTFRDLVVYQKAFKLAMEIFNLTKNYPDDEKYGLTTQIRRSSRGVCSSIAEAYRKRKYPAHFVSKITDADMENSETQVWIEFSYKCNYINTETYNNLLNQSEEIGKMLNHLINNPKKFE